MPTYSAPDAVDYSFSRANVDQLVAAHIRLVCRYLSHDSGKNLTAAEARALLAAGIAILLNWETSAGRAQEGYAAGVQDGKDAAALAKSIGAPLGLIIYFSVDFDPAGKLPIIGDYLRGVKAGLAGSYGVGVYGSDDVVDYAHSNGLTSAEWQAFAWSAGRLSPEADLYQYLNGQTLAGASVDFDKIIHPRALGAWGLDAGDDMPLNSADVNAVVAGVAAMLKKGGVLSDLNTQTDQIDARVNAQLLAHLPRIAGVLRWGTPNAVYTAERVGALADGKGISGDVKDTAVAQLDVHALAAELAAAMPADDANALIAALGAAITKGAA